MYIIVLQKLFCKWTDNSCKSLYNTSYPNTTLRCCPLPKNLLTRSYSSVPRSIRLLVSHLYYNLLFIGTAYCNNKWIWIWFLVSSRSGSFSVMSPPLLLSNTCMCVRGHNTHIYIIHNIICTYNCILCVLGECVCLCVKIYYKTSITSFRGRRPSMCS